MIETIYYCKPFNLHINRSVFDEPLHRVKLGKLKFLEKFLRWIHYKLGAYTEQYEINVERISIDIKNLSDFILKYQYEMEVIGGHRLKYLIIGQSQFMQFFREGKLEIQMFAIDYKSNFGEFNLHGVKVILNPFIDGVCPIDDSIQL